jgi:hypothetical protein
MKWAVIDAFAALGTTTRNRFAWSAQSEDRAVTALTLWEDEISDDGITVIADTFNSPSIDLWKDSPRNKTRIRHLRDVWNGDRTFRVVMLQAKEPGAHPRKTKARWPDDGLTMNLQGFNPVTGEFRAEGRRTGGEAIPIADDAAGTKYQPLFHYLSSRNENSVQIPLADIEKMVGLLPITARTHQFWANTGYHLARRRNWLDAGFHAFFRPIDDTVLFERQAIDSWQAAAMPQLALITSDVEVRSAFCRWQSALLGPAEFEGDNGWLPDEQFAVSAYGHAPAGNLSDKTSLGVEPFGDNWAVQINAPKSPSTENGLSAIATDKRGSLYLVRQGRLQSNNQSELITEDDFKALSGLTPAEVWMGDNPASRLWYVVTPITEDDEEMRRNTGEFVKVCAQVRAIERSDRSQVAADMAEIEERFGQDERGGTSTYQPKGGSRVMKRRHGEVWQALKSIAGDALRKPFPARGYEADGEICSAAGNVLIEIKTGRSANDVYAGTGQLQIYSRMLKRLERHRKTLLLPGKPSKALASALSEIGIELHVYEIRDSDDWTTATFTSDFLMTCGLSQS